MILLLSAHYTDYCIRTLASTIQRVFYLFCSTGVVKVKLDGFHFWTPSSWSDLLVDAKQRHTGRLLLHSKNSTASS